MFEKVIVSCDDKFAPFRNIVKQAWKKFFPEVTIDICYVGVNPIEEENTYNYKPIQGVPIGNLGKVLRLYHASLQGDTVCSIHDIDTIPLQSEYLTDLLSLRKKGSLCLVGSECYLGSVDQGKAPMVPTTAEGCVFKNLLKADGSWEDFVNNNLNIQRYDEKENLMSTYFSDESLIRYYLDDFEGSVIRLRRDEKRQLIPEVHWIDRTFRKFGFDKNLLFNGFYTECNMERPYNPDRLKIIEEYLKF